jgi:hypothetical protein
MGTDASYFLPPFRPNLSPLTSIGARGPTLKLRRGIYDADLREAPQLSNESKLTKNIRVAAHIP